MPANLPQPLQISGSPRRGGGEQALLTLLQQAPSIALQLLQQRQQGQQQEQQLGIQQQGVDIRQQGEDRLQQAQDIEIQQQTNIRERTAGAVAAARDSLSRDPTNGPQLVEAFNATLLLNASGLETSQIASLVPLPQSEKAKVDLATAGIQLTGLEDQAQADEFATNWLVEQGTLPAGAPSFPGAGDTLLSIQQAREGQAINWLEKGLAFVTGRVGESSGGQADMLALLTGGGAVGEAVGVEQAITEWRSVIESYAPENIRERELARLETGAWQRKLTLELAKNEVLAILQVTPEADEGTIRETLRGAFTPQEINEILSGARRRIGPQR